MKLKNEFFQLEKLRPQPNMDIDQLEFAVNNKSDVEEVFSLSLHHA